MNNSDRNAAKSMVFYIIVFLFVFITLIISVLLLGVLSSERLKIVLIITLTIESLGFITLLFFLFKLFKSIDVINSQAGQIAQGNLRIDDIPEQETFGLGILTDVFNSMKANLLRFIVLTKVNIISISDAIENVSNSMNSSYLGNEQIAANMEDVAQKSKEQAGLMGNAMSKINEVKTRIEIITQMKTKRVAYFGANVDSTGIVAVRIMAKALGGKGEVAIFTGEGNNFGRHNILSELKKYKNIKVAAQVHCADDIEASYNATKDILRENSNIRAILVPGMGFFGAAKAIEEIGFIGKTFLICFFYGNEIAEYIKKGIVYSAISHDPFDQGYDSVVHLYNMLVTGDKPKNEINWSRVDIIDERGIYELL